MCVCVEDKRYVDDTVCVEGNRRESIDVRVEIVYFYSSGARDGWAGGCKNKSEEKQCRGAKC